MVFTPCFAASTETTSGGTVEAEHAAPGIVCFRVVGEGNEDTAHAILRALNPVFTRDGDLHVFHDWQGVTSYTSGARTLLTDWTRPRSAHFRTTMLFQSRILAMGVSVAGMVVPGLRSLSDPAVFATERDAAIAAALAKA